MSTDSILEPLVESGAIRAFSVGTRLDGAPFDAALPESVERLAAFASIRSLPRQARQVHGDDLDVDGTLEACDAFLVRPGEAALVRHADCYPVVVAAPAARLAVVAHCGWKGVLAGLATKSVRQLLLSGASPEDLVAAIGPGIGPDSFEVGPEVLGLFPEEFHATTRRGTPSVDLPAMLRRQLSDSGIADSAIRTSPIDTFASADWHSHRRGRESAGRNGSLCIVLPATPPIARS